MAELIVALTELLGVAGVAVRYRNLQRAPVFVSTWVACLVFVLFGAVFGGLFAALMATWHPAVSLAIGFLVLFALSAIVLFSGVSPGFSLTSRAVCSYVFSFFLGATSLVLLFHRLG
jgi:small basic protein